MFSIDTIYRYMTQSVVEKTSIPEKTWRRQTDSPTWWIAFSCGSVILHLLAFWLISLYKLPASQFGSASAVPIEFIEISPQKPPTRLPQPKPKPVLPKPSAKPIAPQNSQQSVNSSAVKPPVIRNDEDAIAFNQKIEQKLVEQQRQQELLQQQKLAEQQRQQELLQQQKLAEQQRQLEAEQLQREAEQLRQRQAQQDQLEAQLRQKEQLQQRQLAERLRQQEQEQKRALQAQRQQEKEQKRALQAQRQLEAQKERQLAAEEQRQNPADGEKITAPILDRYGETVKEASVNQQTPDSPVKDNRLEQIPLNQNQETQLNQSGGILTATWNIEPDKFSEPKPEELAQPLTGMLNNSDIPLSRPKDRNFQPGNFLVWLTIDDRGNALVMEIETSDLERKAQYRKYAEEIFNGQKFSPVSEKKGNHLPIRINIQSSSN